MTGDNSAKARWGFLIAGMVVGALFLGPAGAVLGACLGWVAGKVASSDASSPQTLEYDQAGPHKAEQQSRSTHRTTSSMTVETATCDGTSAPLGSALTPGIHFKRIGAVAKFTFDLDALAQRALKFAQQYIRERMDCEDPQGMLAARHRAARTAVNRAAHAAVSRLHGKQYMYETLGRWGADDLLASMPFNDIEAKARRLVADWTQTPQFMDRWMVLSKRRIREGGANEPDRLKRVLNALRNASPTPMSARQRVFIKHLRIERAAKPGDGTTDSITAATAFIDDLLSRRRKPAPRPSRGVNRFVALAVDYWDGAAVKGVAAVEFADGMVASKWYSYVSHPDAEVDDGRGRPFSEAASDLRKILRGAVALHHRHGDRNALLNAFRRHGGVPPQCRRLDADEHNIRADESVGAADRAEVFGHAFVLQTRGQRLDNIVRRSMAHKAHPPDAVPAGDCDFVAIDVELANSDAGSICQIGAVRVQGGCITDEFDTLVNPECAFAARNTSVHGLRAEDVRRAPKYPDACAALAKFIGSGRCVLAAHLGPDKSAFEKAEKRHGRHPARRAQWVNTLTVARRTWPNLQAHSLKDVCTMLGVYDAAKHHSGVADARMCAHILIEATRKTGGDVGAWL